MALDPSLTKNALTTRARKIAYGLLDHDLPWTELPAPPDYLAMKKGDSLLGPNAKEGVKMNFAGLFEVGPDGTQRPLSEETKERMRNERANLVGNYQKLLPIPEGENMHAVQLAAKLLEGAFFRTHTRSLIFNEENAGGLVSVDLAQNQESGQLYVRLRTNVRGHIETTSMPEIAKEIDQTANEIDSEWVEDRGKKGKELRKEVRISGHFPFLTDWLYCYANALGMQDKIDIHIGYNLQETHPQKDIDRYIMMLQSEDEIPPAVGVSLQGQLAQQMKKHGFSLTKVPEMEL